MGGAHVAPIDAVSDVGQMLADDHLLWGHSLLGEVMGHATYTEYLFLAVCRRLPTPLQRDFLDVAWVATAAADPAVPPVKLSRLLASFGHPEPGLAGGVAYQQDARVGPPVGIGITEWVLEVARRLDVDPAADDEVDVASVDAALAAILDDRRYIPGAGVPLRDADERHGAFVAVATEQLDGMCRRVAWQIGLRAADYLRGRGFGPNISLALVAGGLALGLSPTEIVELMRFAVMPLHVANAIDGAARADPTLQLLPADVVTYRGPGPRRSPRSEAVAG